MFFIEWCSFCNAAPSEGTLTVIEVGTEEPFPRPSCNECARSIIAESGGIEEK